MQCEARTSFRQQQLGEVAAVLAGDAGDERDLPLVEDGARRFHCGIFVTAGTFELLLLSVALSVALYFHVGMFDDAVERRVLKRSTRDLQGRQQQPQFRRQH